jgi:hypothetical protein
MVAARWSSRASGGSRQVRSVVAAVLVATSLAGFGAAGAVTGVSAEASTPAPAAAPAATSISIRTLKPSIDAGRTGTVVGNLQVAGLSAEGRAVALEAMAVGESEFTPVGSALAGRKGNLRVIVRPEVTTRYRWSYAGEPDAEPRVSGVATLKVRTKPRPQQRRATTISVLADRGAVAEGGRDVLRGTLRAGHDVLARKYVVLLSRTATEPDWEFRTSRRTGREGRVAFGVRPVVPTEFRLAYAGSPLHRPATSAVVEVDMRPTVTIVVEPPEVEPGESLEVAGSVVHAGSPVAGATVELQARTLQPKGAWEVLSTATSAVDGTVSFDAAPAATTRYRLRVQPVAGLPTGTSRAVDVQVRKATSGYGRRTTGSITAAESSAARVG